MPEQPINIQLHIFRSPQLWSIVQEATTFFNNTPTPTLPPTQGFPGVGVYALYYLGDFEPYDYLTVRNQPECTQPIYVGKSVPRGWRTARVSPSEIEQNLFGRLLEHTHSIQEATNLEISHFRCRFMILIDVEADLIATVEAQLIRLYRPLWNTTIDGFGNHDPGSGRYNQSRSEWDVLHQGRPWADRLTGIPPELPSIIAKIQQDKERVIAQPPS